jgi:O-antigen/teichoic acid export membrane protein
MMRDLWIRILQTGGARVYSLLTGLLVLTITARWLGPAGRGEMAASVTWVNLFYMVSFLSLNSVLLHRATAGTLDLGRVFGTLIAFTGLVTVAGWVVALVLWLARGEAMWGPIRPSVLATAFLLLPFLIWEQYGNALLIGIDRLNLYNRAVIAAKTIACVMVLIFFTLHLGVRAAILATVLGQFGLCLAGIPEIIRRTRGSIAVDWHLLREMSRDGLKMHTSTVATFLYASIGTLIINRYVGAASTGFYHTATQLIEVMLVVPYAANLVMFSKASQLGVQGAWEMQRRLVIILPLAMVGMAIVAALAAPFAIPLVVGKAFVPSVGIFRMLLPATVLATFSAVMSSQWVGRGYFAALSAMTIAGAIVNVSVNFALARTMGVRGAVIATLLSYGVVAICNVAFAIRCERAWRRQQPADLPAV